MPLGKCSRCRRLFIIARPATAASSSVPQCRSQAASAPAAPRASVSLAGEARLANTVDLDEPYVTLQEALARIEGRTGVELRADRELEGENVVLFIRSR